MCRPHPQACTSSQAEAPPSSLAPGNGVLMPRGFLDSLPALRHGQDDTGLHVPDPQASGKGTSLATLRSAPQGLPALAPSPEAMPVPCPKCSILPSPTLPTPPSTHTPTWPQLAPEGHGVLQPAGPKRRDHARGMGARAEPPGVALGSQVAQAAIQHPCQVGTG